MNGNPPIVHEVLWDRRFDADRFNNPMKGVKHGFSVEPTVSFRQAELPFEKLELKLAHLRQIVVPMFIDDGSVGVDGESFGVETYGFRSAVRLVWWAEGYSEWKPLVQWATDMRQFLKMSLGGQRRR